MVACATSSLQSSVLALNRQYAAVQVVSARRAFCLLCKGQAEVISVEDGSYQAHTFESWLETCELRMGLGDVDDHADWVRSVNFSIQVPRVIRLLDYDRMPKNTVKFNRRNIFLRDENRCQYCGRKFGGHRLSLDHVLPRSRGGPTSWENIVCSCLDCNVRKGSRTPQEAGMNLISTPHKPARNPSLYHHLTSPRYQVWRAFLRTD